jgi:Cu/Ag efflux protein CusF
MGVRARLRRVPPLALALGVVFALSGVAVAVQVAPSVAQACGSDTYSTRGVVKSFGPDRKFVNIAHEKIAGYMEAMTMSFEPRTAEQLAGLSAGDKVSFSFTETADGRRLLNSVKKE